VRFDINAGLRVVGLLKAATGGGHNAGLLIRQVDLVFGLRPGCRCLRRLAPRLFAGLILVRLTLCLPGFKLRLFALKTCLRTDLDFLFGASNRKQPFLYQR
jgi:hypothetical protein